MPFDGKLWMHTLKCRIVITAMTYLAKFKANEDAD